MDAKRRIGSERSLLLEARVWQTGRRAFGHFHYLAYSGDISGGGSALGYGGLLARCASGVLPPAARLVVPEYRTLREHQDVACLRASAAAPGKLRIE